MRKKKIPELLHIPSLFRLFLSISKYYHHQRFVLQTTAARKHNGIHGNQTANRQRRLIREVGQTSGWMDGWMDVRVDGGF